MPETVEIISRLPSSPVYMSMIITEGGKPRGYPIWNSFENIASKRVMNNETMASTFISLAKNLSDISSDKKKDGKIMMVTLEEKTYNIYTPYAEDDFQIAFVVVFEDRDNVLIKPEHKEELVKRIVKRLRKNKSLRKHLDEVADKTIEKSTSLYEEVSQDISKVLVKWDGKRVEYLHKEAKHKRDELLKELDKHTKFIEELEKESAKIEKEVEDN